MISSGWGNRIRLASAVAFVAIAIGSSLQHGILPVVPESRWRHVARLFPGLAFGYVMFDRIPDELPYYRLTSGLDEVAPAQVDSNGAWGYADARFQLNLIFQPDYLAETCRSSARPFVAHHMLRDLRTGREILMGSKRCDRGVLVPSATESEKP